MQAVAAMRHAEDDGGDVAEGVPLTVGRMLLDLIDALERSAYNAYEGSCLLAPAPPACLPFFCCCWLQPAACIHKENVHKPIRMRTCCGYLPC